MDARERGAIAAQLRATAAGEGWSPWWLAREIHRQTQAPTLLMAWRLATGHTQDDVVRGIRGLAADDGTPCAPSPNNQQLSRWENGKDNPGPFYRRYLALWYRCPPDRLGLGDPDPLPTLKETPRDPGLDMEDHVDRRQFLALAATAPALAHLGAIRERMDSSLRHVLPSTDVEQWWDISVGHTGSYGQLAPAELLSRLAPDLAEIADLADRYPRQRDLHVVVSRLCGLTGAVHTDLDNDREARSWLQTAARYAELSGDRVQQCWVAMAQAMTAFYSSAPSVVIHIAARTTSRLGDAPSAPGAQLAGLAARAHAHLGRTDAARADLQRAHDLFGQLDHSQHEEGFFGFPSRELDMYTSQVLSRINDPAAWEAQTSALAAYPPDEPMDRPLIQLDRAIYLTQRGEPDEAATTAADAITSLPTSMRVPLLMAQARQVGDRIAQLSTNAASQLREQLALTT